MFVRSFAAFLLCLQVSLTFAYEKPDVLVLNHLSNPAAVAFIPLIEKTYADIGIKVEFVSLTSERGLISVDSGIVDGDLVRDGHSLRHFDNVIGVNPPLATGAKYLLCAKGNPCNAGVFESEASIFATRRLIANFPEKFAKTFNGEFVEIERYLMILELIKKKRGKYALFDVKEGHIPPDIKLNFNLFKMNTFSAVHVLNAKHQYLVPELEHALAKNLKLMN